ncbi:NAD(P)-dependent alcohol dehydrogenase [Patulibacter defluvii]|uniref:NAD(P)-dependent alcohol dehydrogenase n=1 Tax=Patulibacter defluvii TaxID=3095358 RepID=UPI002A760A18|nr:NAD(P)-dependent alcohol dehydrogenase [Patulibacter sp. DM4]
MQAFQLLDWQQPPALREVDVPEPSPGQVLLKVGGAGACHSDLHLMEWPAGQLPFAPPFTLGHENAGWVAALGSGVEGLDVGDAVAVYGPWGCGRCRACRASQENLCERQREIGAFGGGLGRDGGMAPYMLVPSPRLLIPLGDLDPREAAPLGDAALTPYHAIKRSLPILGPGTTAVVIGIGGLGQMAVQLLRALTSARIVAVDPSAPHRERARACGADETLAPGPDAAASILERTAGRGAQLVLDVVGGDGTLELGRTVAAVGGHLTVLGLAGGSLTWSAMGVLPWECSLTSTYWGSAIELVEVLDLARAGRIRTAVERYPLARAGDAYAALREGRVAGRAVVCPNG